MGRFFIDTEQVHHAARELRSIAGQLGHQTLELERSVARTPPPPVELNLYHHRIRSICEHVRSTANGITDCAHELDRSAWFMDAEESQSAGWLRLGTFVRPTADAWGTWLGWGVGVSIAAHAIHWIRDHAWPGSPRPSTPTTLPTADSSGKPRSAATAPTDRFPQVGTPSEAQSRVDQWFPTSIRRGWAKNDCVTWAFFRRQELGLAKPPHGDGGNMDGQLGYGPKLLARGTLVSYPGHVMVIEDVLSSDPPKFTVSEMNGTGSGSGVWVNRTWTRLNNGSWECEFPGSKYGRQTKPFLEFIPPTPLAA